MLHACVSDYPLSGPGPAYARSSLTCSRTIKWTETGPAPAAGMPRSDPDRAVDQV
ncbi:hypothetical protein JXQ70_10970 [bacterium]|nr:hypothetical protein [bacterium]